MTVSDSLQRYLDRAGSEFQSPNLAFDEKWYRHRYPEVNQAVAAGVYRCGWEHYLSEGAKKQYNPVAWFDETWYLFRSSDAAQGVKCGALLCGFEHYLLYGIRQELAPSIYFSPAWYNKITGAPGQGHGTYSIVQYLLAAENSRPVPVAFFDGPWYRTRYLGGPSDLPSIPEPFQHYLFYGRSCGFSPSPKFNEMAYREAHPEAAAKIAAGVYSSAFEHYATEGVLEGMVAPTHLETSGVDYAGPEFLPNYEYSVRVNFRQLALLRELAQTTR
ncbi:MAG TPA: hypothetical protein VEQ63_11445 [Bryobacteraceae bacterium]|nr:hypothetical protein [Bryobacteraceae bacterium]